MTTTAKERADVMTRLTKLGIAYSDACALRRIAMTLRRWFELECGDGNDLCSWAIVRGHGEKREFYRDPDTQEAKWRTVKPFEYDDAGKPYMEKHYHNENRARYVQIPDRETGARKRLAAILAKYPTLHAYVQTDPRGASLYLLTSEQISWYGNKPLDEIYNNGVAVY